MSSSTSKATKRPQTKSRDRSEGPKRVFITGSFGNVGSNAVRYLLERNAMFTRPDHPLKVKVTCFDKATPAAKKIHAELVKDFEENEFFQTIWGDLTIEEDVKRAVRDQDAIIHLAAMIPPMAYKVPDVARKVNVDGTAYLINAARESGYPRFVLASSYSVHGSRNCQKPLPLLRGDTPVKPGDNYAGHKVECERMIEQYEGEWSILRIGSVSLTFKLAFAATPNPKGLEALLFGTPRDQRRHGVHSKDVARAFCECAITDKPVHGKRLMIGGDASWVTTAEQFTAILLSAAGLSDGHLPRDAYRRPLKDADDAFYYEDWMDTFEAQQLLQFQRHTTHMWRQELENEISSVQYWITRLVAPLVLYSMSRNSPFLKLNRSGTEYPEQRMTMSEITGTRPEKS